VIPEIKIELRKLKYIVENDSFLKILSKKALKSILNEIFFYLIKDKFIGSYNKNEVDLSMKQAKLEIDKYLNNLDRHDSILTPFKNR
jgi:hypothetical protein